MKRYVGLVVGLIVIVAGFVTVSSRATSRVEKAQAAENFAALQAKYLERVGWIRSNPDEKSYLSEVNPFLRLWFGGVDEHHKRFGGNPEFDDYLQKLEQRAQSGQKAKGADPKVHYDYVRAQFDTLRAGKHAPTFTATDKGMRLDVTTEETMVGGEPHVRYRVLLWGANRELKDTDKGKKMLTSANFTVGWRFTDERGKLLAEMNAQDPSMKIDWPELLIAEFPPQMVFGHYDVGLLPYAVKKAEITFTVSSRAQTGGEALAKYVWKLDVPQEWKLAQGQQWVGAEESTRDPEEIGGN